MVFATEVIAEEIQSVEQQLQEIDKEIQKIDSRTRSISNLVPLRSPSRSISLPASRAPFADDNNKSESKVEERSPLRSHVTLRKLATSTDKKKARSLGTNLFRSFS